MTPTRKLHVTSKQCENCRFWIRWTDDEKGLCRESPPEVHTDMLQTIIDNYGATDDNIFEAASSCTLWPITLETQWCGKHEEAEDE